MEERCERRPDAILERIQFAGTCVRIQQGINVASQSGVARTGRLEVRIAICPVAWNGFVQHVLDDGPLFGRHRSVSALRTCRSTVSAL